MLIESRRVSTGSHSAVFTELTDIGDDGRRGCWEALASASVFQSDHKTWTESQFLPITVNGMIIRVEQSADVEAIHHVVASAFGRTDEADLVACLRKRDKSVLSMVAEERRPNVEIVGHLLFSEATLANNPFGTKVVGLAPLSVTPASQRQGVGALLTRAGLEWCKAEVFGAVIVLGHPEYYTRFGFVPASRFGIHSEYDVRDESFMAMELMNGALAGCTGLVRYQPEFNELSN